MSILKSKISKINDSIRAMGWKYWKYRILYELKKKSKHEKSKYPTQVEKRIFASKDEWIAQKQKFFFSDREHITLPHVTDELLEKRIEKMLNGTFTFFYDDDIYIGKNYNWVINPLTGYTYSETIHWSAIPDMDASAGDIKYVWEKSRFCYVYDFVRYDKHYNNDHSEFVFSEILSWIKHNPINCGPNYISSQEIALRIFNWTFVMYYYKHAKNFTNDIFNDIMHHIYWQVKHIDANSDFSKIAVRNNHTLSEALCLFMCGVLFPFLPEAEAWKQKGKQIFEEEIQYQIFDDGTFLQYSMNYHRIVIQLMTWALQLAKLNDIVLDKSVYEKALKSYTYLNTCMNNVTGFLPNYGANDGALFFPLNSKHFRNYKPQLQALASVLSIQDDADEIFEDTYWINNGDIHLQKKDTANKIFAFEKSGYYGIKEHHCQTFIRCGSHKNRPSQADNLHLDIFYDNENIFRDAGSYMYNTTDELKNYFFGTASHNTVMLGPYNQMEKGKRFIWNYWTQSLKAQIHEYDTYFEFSGSIKAFRQTGKWITHTRYIKKYKNTHVWEVTDELSDTNNLQMHQIWNYANGNTQFTLSAVDAQGNILEPHIKNGWYSETYGVKELSIQTIFSTNEKLIKTIIEINP